MTIICIKANIYMEIDDGVDKEHVVGSLDSGLESAIMDFPLAEVLGVRVESFSEMTPAEISDAGLDNM